MGISCLQSYKGAQLFQSVGLSSHVVSKCFRGMQNAIEGVGFDVLHDDALRLHRIAYPIRALAPLVAGVDTLPDWGDYHFRSVHDTEVHVNSPDVIANLQVRDGVPDWGDYHFHSVHDTEVQW